MISLLRSLALWVFVGLAVVKAQSLQANVVLDWDALAIDAIRTDDSGPTLSTPNLAILHTSIYDAVNSIQHTHQPYQFHVDSAENTSAEAAAVSAGHEILVALYPSLKGRADALYATYINGVSLTADLTNGIALGSEVAQLTLLARSADGSQTDVPYVPSDAPGQWRRTPPLFLPPLTPQWRYVTPFCVPAVDPYVPGPPPSLDSAEYARDFNEVKALGAKNSLVRTADQSQIAVFWSDFSYTSMPPGHWHEIAAVIAKDRQLDLADTARLFALISLAQADAAIVCWETKYRYNLWRPITAIQGADKDDNPATAADPAWNHYLNSPPFPSYTSGHSSFSKASAEILTSFFGTDAISFSIGSDSIPGVLRSFTSLSACADEIGQSRVYGGIHFQFDNRVGKAVGKKIANYVTANFLLSNGELPKVRLEALTNGLPLLRVQGHLGAVGVLEATEDFVNWQPVSTNASVVGGKLVLDSALPVSRRFYRVRE